MVIAWGLLTKPIDHLYPLVDFILMIDDFIQYVSSPNNASGSFS
jgi:hypothetical protein